MLRPPKHPGDVKLKIVLSCCRGEFAGAQRLGPVEHDEDALLDIEAALDQVCE
jgi:hypothetical protein